MTGVINKRRHVVTETDTHIGKATSRPRKIPSEDGRLEGYIFKARTPGGARARTEAGN